MAITQKELDIILFQHELWVASDSKEGKIANFTGQDVRGLDND